MNFQVQYNQEDPSVCNAANLLSYWRQCVSASAISKLREDFDIPDNNCRSAVMRYGFSFSDARSLHGDALMRMPTYQRDLFPSTVGEANHCTKFFHTRFQLQPKSLCIFYVAFFDPFSGHGFPLLGASRSHSFSHITLGITPLDEWPTRRRDLYLTAHNPVRFEPTIPASEWPKTHALDRTATGIGSIQGNS
jgi:hypothetical protein